MGLRDYEFDVAPELVALARATLNPMRDPRTINQRLADSQPSPQSAFDARIVRRLTNMIQDVGESVDDVIRARLHRLRELAELHGRVGPQGSLGVVDLHEEDVGRGSFTGARGDLFDSRHNQDMWTGSGRSRPTGRGDGIGSFGGVRRRGGFANPSDSRSDETNDREDAHIARSTWYNESSSAEIARTDAERTQNRQRRIELLEQARQHEERAQSARSRAYSLYRGMLSQGVTFTDDDPTGTYRNTPGDPLTRATNDHANRNPSTGPKPPPTTSPGSGAGSTPNPDEDADGGFLTDWDVWAVLTVLQTLGGLIAGLPSSDTGGSGVRPAIANATDREMLVGTDLGGDLHHYLWNLIDPAPLT